MLNFNSANITLVDFANLHIVSDSETLAEYIRLRYFQGDTIGTIINDVSHKKYSVDTKWINWQALVTAILTHSPDKLNGDFNGVYLYQEELDELKKIESEFARKFLYLALIVHKWNRHSSGWVRYERDDFFKFWGLQRLKNKEKEAVAHEAVEHGLELRVIGSKNPIICYHISFQQQVGEVVAIFDNEEQIKQWWEWLGL